MVRAYGLRTHISCLKKPGIFLNEFFVEVLIVFENNDRDSVEPKQSGCFRRNKKKHRIPTSSVYSQPGLETKYKKIYFET